MKKIIVYMIFAVLMSSIANAEKYFVLDVNQIIGSVSFNGISVREVSTPIRYTDKTGFLVKSISFQNGDIDNIYYDMQENRKYLIYIPYNENAARIEVYNPKNSKIMDIDVSSFADTCGNSVCEEHESHESCTKDCKSGSKDDFCDEIKDGICDPDCSSKTDTDCISLETQANQSAFVNVPNKQSPKNQKIENIFSYKWWIFSAFGILALLLLFLLFKKRKEGKTIGILKQYVSENLRKGFTLQQIKDVLFREGYTEREIDKAVKSI